LNLFIYLFILKGTTYFATLLDCINRQAIQILFFIKGTFLIIKTAPHILFTLRSCKFPNKILAEFPPKFALKILRVPNSNRLGSQLRFHCPLAAAKVLVTGHGPEVSLFQLCLHTHTLARTLGAQIPSHTLAQDGKEVQVLLSCLAIIRC